MSFAWIAVALGAASLWGMFGPTLRQRWLLRRYRGQQRRDARRGRRDWDRMARR